MIFPQNYIHILTYLKYLVHKLPKHTLSQRNIDQCISIYGFQTREPCNKNEALAQKIKFRHRDKYNKESEN